MAKGKITIALAAAHAAAILLLGAISFGPWTAFIFSFGFLGGFFLWLASPSSVSFFSVRVPYWLTLGVFIFLHKIEENIFKFQEELAKLTGNPVPDIASPSLFFLLLLSVGGWIFVPYLMERRTSLGTYMAWSFFASMGFTELAHFALPAFTQQSYGYFPGMASVVLLAPAAWWGMWRLSRQD